METCSFKDISRLLLMVLLTLFKTPFAGSYTASTDSDHAEMTRYYSDIKTHRGEITAAPTLVSLRTQLSTETTDGSRAAESTDAFPALSKDEDPLTETSSVPKHNIQTGNTLDTEGSESPSQTASTYIFSTISRAGERTLLSVLTNSTTVYTEESNSSETTSLSSPQEYQTSTRTFPRNTSHSSPTSSFSSSQASSQSSRTHDSYEMPSQTSPHSSSWSSSEPSPETSSQASSQTLHHTLPEGSQTSTGLTSQAFSDDSYSKVFYESSQTSSQTSPRNFTGSVLPKNTANKDSTDETTPFGTDQLSTSTLNVTNKSPDVYSRDTPDSTLPLTIPNESTDNMDVTNSVHLPEGRTSYSETRHAVSISPPALSTEDSIPDTSHLGQDKTVTLEGDAEITTESSTRLQQAKGNEETGTVQESTDALSSTKESTVVIDEDDSRTEIQPSWKPSTIDTEQPVKTTGAPPSVQWTTTQKSEFTEGRTYRSSTQSLASVPPTHTPSVLSPTARPQTSTPTLPTTMRASPAPQTWNQTSEDPSAKTGGTSSHSFKGTVTTSHVEVSTVIPSSTAGHTQTPTTAYKHTMPPRPTTPHTTGGFKGRTSTTEVQTTTVRAPEKTTLVPGSACGSKQCLNGGVCVLGEGGRPRCECLTAWTGQDCSVEYDGFKLENNTCVRCPFGFGGLNCENFYKLIVVVVLPVVGVLLLVLAIALIVTCCRKDRNDINKIIFKSGDFQMSPYTEYPKSNRMSGEWGREAIEMQENGSTKNLLQMTDIYYTAALRHPDWPSRQSCIYPAQWNPSFINDDTRRRDYF